MLLGEEFFLDVAELAFLKGLPVRAARRGLYRDKLVDNARSPKELLNRASSLAPSERLLVFGEDRSVDGRLRLDHACCFVASAKQGLGSATATVRVRVLNLL